MRHPLALGLVSLVLAGCILPAASDDLPAATTPIAPPERLTPVVRFIALGDMGTGEEPQRRVAKSIETVCANLGCDFVAGLGDNIYEAGVTSPYDPQFDLKFEQPYSALSIPFYMTLGNHDNGVNGNIHAAGDFEVMYAARSDRASDKWQMPARWYAHEHGHVRFLALDTNIVFGQIGIVSSDADGARQKAWLIEQLSSPTNATWTFAHGHHPYISNGQHSNAEPNLKAWFEETLCGKVDVLFVGHEHDLQWLVPVESCGKTEFLISGAGAKTRPLADEDQNEAYFQAGNTLGFAWVEVAGDRFTGRFYDGDAALLFERSFLRQAAT